MTQRIRTLLSTALVLSLALVVAGPHPRVSAAAPAPQLRIVGPAGEDPPVVNERKKLKLRVVDETCDETCADVTVTAWSAGSPAVAKVTKKGVLKGRLYGFVTITAQTGRGEVSTTAVVARVTRRHGSMGDGDTKSDTAGRIYLTSPDEQVIYRSDGVRDEIFAGTKGEAGYQDGTGQNARFHYPTGLGVDVSTNGGLYVADTDNHCIRKVGFDGRTSVATGFPQFSGRIDADVVPADEAVFDSPKGVAAFGQSLFVADTRNHALYYLNGRGDAVSLLAGQPGVLGFRNGLFRDASFNLPSGLAINTEGNLLAVADTGNHAVRLVRIESGGNPYLGRVSTAGVASKAGRGTPGTGFVFSAPTSVAFDSAQNVCVVDSQGASVITRAADGTEARVLLAQPGSLGRPASIVVSGTRAIIADADASSPGVAIAVVEVGAPKITGLTPSQLPELVTTSEIVIEGDNFPPEARVVFDGKLVDSVRVESAKRIVFSVFEPTRGAALVSVITRGGVAQLELNVVPPRLEDLEVGDITTYAGTDHPSYGDGGLSTDAIVGATQAVNVDGSGNVYVTSAGMHRVRRIDAQSRVITTHVGTGRAEFIEDGFPSTAFGLYAPVATAVGRDGTIFVADGLERVVKVDPVTTQVTTVLGQSKVPGMGADGAPAGPDFLLSSPTALAVDGNGNLFVADAGNKRVLRVDAASQVVRVVAGGGPVEGVPTDGTLPTALSFRVDSLDVRDDGVLALEVWSDVGGSIRTVILVQDARVRVVEPSGQEVAFGVNEDLYFTMGGRVVVRLELSTGRRTSVAGGGESGVLGDGGPALLASLEIADIAIDGAGDLFLSDTIHQRVRRVERESGVISTVAGGMVVDAAGDNGCPTSASVIGMGDIAWVEGLGLCITDNAVHGLRVVDSQSSTISTPIGGGPATPPVWPEDGELARGPTLTLSTVACGGPSRALFGHTPSGRAPTSLWAAMPLGTLERIAGPGIDLSDGIPARSASIGRLADLLRTPDGDVYLVDSQSRRVRRIEHSTQIIQTIAGRIHDGDAYTGEGRAAVDATLEAPSSIAIAPNGDLIVVDGRRILRVGGDGIIRTVSGGDETGIPIVGQLIDKVRYGQIGGLAVDGAGNIFVADSVNHLVVVLDAVKGVVRFVVGHPGQDYNNGDGLPAFISSIEFPGSIVLDDQGNLFVASLAQTYGLPVVRVIKGAGHRHPVTPGGS